MIKKQIKTIIAIVLVLCALFGSALLLKHFNIVDIFGSNDVQDDNADKPKYDEDGDLLGTSDRPFIYDTEKIELKDVSTIEIQNINAETGEKRNFRFYMDPIAENLILEGREMLSFDKEALSNLYMNTCYMLAIAKISNPTEDLKEYGLPNGKSDNWFIVTTADGEKKQIYIGDKIPTGGGYYCKSVDKPHIYIIDTMIESCVLAGPEAFIVPMLCTPFSQEKMYTVDNIRIIKDGELTVGFELALQDESTANDGTSYSHTMTYPGGYTVSQTVMDTIVTKLSNFTGTEVVTSDLFDLYNVKAEETDDGKETNDESVLDENKKLRETLEKYGLLKPSHEIHYTLDGETYRIIFGGKTEDGGSYYALNMSQMIVCTVACADVPFIDYNVIDFVDEYIFQMNIDNIASLKVTAKNIDETFELSGEKQELTVKRASNGETVDTKSFRQCYIDILLVRMEGAADVAEKAGETLSYTFTTRDGRVFEFKFYDISTTKLFYTVNGAGEFYVNRDSVSKVISDFQKLIGGETVVSEAMGG